MSDKTTQHDNQNHHQHQQAEDDSFLFALRAELPRDFAADLYARLTQKEQLEPMATNILMGTIKPNQRRHIGNLVGFAAACAMLIVCSLIIIFAPRPSSPLADTPNITLADVKPIIADNADSLSSIVTLGKGNIESLAWSPDGETLAVAGSTGIHLHTANNLNAPLQLFGGKAEATSSIVYSPDGAYLAGIRAGDLWIWDAATGTVSNRIEEVIQLLRFNFDSTQLAGLTCGEDANQDDYCERQNLVIWNLDDGTIVDTVVDLQIASAFNAHHRIQLSADLNRFAYGNREQGIVFLYDRLTNRQFSATRKIPENIVPFALSDDGLRLAVYQGISSKPLHFFDLTSPPTEPDITELTPYLTVSVSLTKVIYDLVFLPNSHKLFASKNPMSIYDTDSGEILSNIPAQVYPYTEFALALHPTQPLIAYAAISPYASNLGLLTMVDWQTGETLAGYTGYGGFYNQVVISPDDQQVIGLAYPGLAHQWDIATTPPTESLLFEDDATTYTSTVYFSYTPNGETVYLNVRSDPQSDQFYQVDLQIGEKHITSDDVEGGLGLAGPLATFATTPTGDVLSVDVNGLVKTWTVENPPSIVTLTLDGSGHLSSFATTISPDGQFIASSVCLEVQSPYCTTSELRVWSATTGSLLAVLEINNDAGNYQYEHVWGLRFSPDSRYLAVPGCITTDPTADSLDCLSPQIALWDISPLHALAEDSTPDNDADSLPLTLAPFAGLEGMDFPPHVLAFNPLSTSDNLLFAAGAYDKVMLWQVDTRTGEGTLLHQIDTRTWGLAFNSTGTLLMVGGMGTVELWGTNQ